MQRTVTIVQRRLTHYRVPLFESLRAALAMSGVTLRVLHGTATDDELSKGDAGTLGWAEPLATRYLAGGRICWQPFLSRCRHDDLVVVTQENKLVNNLTALATPGRPPMAFWGHGRNMQARREDGAAERFKSATTRWVDWWFAYTELSAAFVRETGFPAERITVLNNSIDTAELRRQMQRAWQEDAAARRVRLGLGPGPLALYIGSLYGEKRIPFLLQAAEELARRLPGFQLAVAGAGPDGPLVERAAATVPGVRFLGSVRGAAKADWLAAADVILNPGLVGLGILDSFVAGVPMLTTDCRLHSPEIAYLDNGANGVMTEDRLEAYVGEAERALRDGAWREHLRQGALAAGEAYSIENMCDRFAAGILLCLNASGRPASSANGT